MSALEPQRGATYRSYAGRRLFVIEVNARTVVYAETPVGEPDGPELEAPRWLFESVVKERVDS